MGPVLLTPPPTIESLFPLPSPFSEVRKQILLLVFKILFFLTILHFYVGWQNSGTVNLLQRYSYVSALL